jgi:hypothetical protein
MSIGKYISLEEARKKKQIDRFIKEHPSEGSMDKLLEGIKRIATNKPLRKPSKGGRTSGKA